MTSSPLLAPADEYVIERPRLLGALDAADARIRMLIAPAGYGKTTLLRQWLAHNNAHYAWYAVGPEGADVAAVAARIAEATSGIVAGAGRRMLGRLGVSNDPEGEAAIFADILAEELQAWPPHALLAIDDYQALAVSRPCERFIGRLLRHAPVQLVLTTRRRPRWARARSLLYGEAFLLGRRELAMTPSESRQVLTLGEWTDCEQLIELGAGWPAIVGLAARSHQHPLPGGALPPALHAYFAEELFQSLPLERQTLLCQLAATPRLTPALVETISGGHRGEDLLAETEQLGFVGPHEQPDELVFHPLLRAFLEDKLRRHPSCESLVTAVARALLQQGRWDDAWDIVHRFDRPDLLPELVETALPTALQGRRVPTLADWVVLARDREVASPMIDLAEAELAFLAGEHAKAHALAEHAAAVLSDDSSLVAAACTTAGRSACFRLQHERAAALYERALRTASSDSDRRDALWGRFLCALEREDPTWRSHLLELAQEPTPSVKAVLRVATGHLVGSQCGGNPAAALSEWLHVRELLPNSRDPRVRTGFLHQAADVALLGALYSDAEEMGERLLADAAEHRLGFVLPHAYLLMAGVAFGFRRFHQSELFLHRAVASAPDDLWIGAKTESLRIALALARGHDPQPRPLSYARLPPSFQGDYLSSLALAAAVSDAPEETTSLGLHVRRLTRDVRARTLAALATGVSACRERGDVSVLAKAVSCASRRGAWDPLVWTWRSAPEILPALDEIKSVQSELRQVLLRAHDLKLAQRFGIITPAPVQHDPMDALSPRERDVLSLVAAGLGNRQIGQRLFISDVTVKVHLRHIFDKLGVRNRVEAALRATESG